MAPFNVTAEDSTPLISYAPSGLWKDSPWYDTQASNYSGSSLHTTYAHGATATIKFNGTGIWLYGGMRPKYGSYSITVDGKPVANGTAKSDSDAFKKMLGGASGLADGAHTAVLTNTGAGTGVDLDYVTFETQIGSGGNVSETTYDDVSKNLTYAPSSAWNATKQPAWMNGTLHWTSTPDASASMNFAGDAVAIYGTVSPHHGSMEVSIDGRKQTVQGGQNGTVNGLHAQQLLYFVNGLGAQPHNLTVTNKAKSGSGQFIDLDAVKVWSAMGGGGDGSNSTSTSSGTLMSDGSSSSNGTAISDGGSSSNGTMISDGSSNSNGSVISDGSSDLNGTVTSGGSSNGTDTSDDGGSSPPQNTVFTPSDTNSTSTSSSNSTATEPVVPANTVSSFNGAQAATSSLSPSPSATSTTAANDNQNTVASKSHTTTIAVAVGASVGGVLVLLGLLFLLLCLRRRRARQHPLKGRGVPRDPDSPNLPIQQAVSAGGGQWVEGKRDTQGSFYTQRLSTGRSFYNSDAEKSSSSDRWSESSFESTAAMMRRDDSAHGHGQGGGPPQLNLDLDLPSLPVPQPAVARPWTNVSANSRDDAMERGSLRPSRPRRPPSLMLSPA